MIVALWWWFAFLKILVYVVSNRLCFAIVFILISKQTQSLWEGSKIVRLGFCVVVLWNIFLHTCNAMWDNYAQVNTRQRHTVLACPFAFPVNVLFNTSYSKTQESQYKYFFPSNYNCIIFLADPLYPRRMEPCSWIGAFACSDGSPWCHPKSPCDLLCQENNLGFIIHLLFNSRTKFLQFGFFPHIF